MSGAQFFTHGLVSKLPYFIFYRQDEARFSKRGATTFKIAHNFTLKSELQ